jgi:hypothetical protein
MNYQLLFAVPMHEKAAAAAAVRHDGLSVL